MTAWGERVGGVGEGLHPGVYVGEEGDEVGEGDDHVYGAPRLLGLPHQGGQQGQGRPGEVREGGRRRGEGPEGEGVGGVPLPGGQVRQLLDEVLGEGGLRPQDMGGCMVWGTLVMNWKLPLVPHESIPESPCFVQVQEQVPHLT